MSDRGDKGLTSGECDLTVSKDSEFVEVVGMIDEFQARLGLLRVLLKGEENQKVLKIESDLSQIMGSLYKVSVWKESEKRIENIIEEIEKYKKETKNLDKFLAPGKNELEARFNLCRTGCRIAERRLVSLKNKREEKNEFFDGNILKYFNKLSSLFYWQWVDRL